MKSTCDICPFPACDTASAADGTDFKACRKHLKYLHGWVRDHEFELNCESAEAARRSEYEMDYYAGYE